MAQTDALRCFREPKYMENVQRALSIWNKPINRPNISPQWVYCYCKTNGWPTEGLKRPSDHFFLDYWIVTHLDSSEWGKMYACWLKHNHIRQH
jgi:hypothetical protein